MPKTKVCQQPPEAEKGRKDLPPEPLEGVGPANILISAQRNLFQTFNLQNCERIDFCCSKPPSLWSFVRAATGKEHSHYKQCYCKYPGHVHKAII